MLPGIWLNEVEIWFSKIPRDLIKVCQLFTTAFKCLLGQASISTFTRFGFLLRVELQVVTARFGIQVRLHAKIVMAPGDHQNTDSRIAPVRELQKVFASRLGPPMLDCPRHLNFIRGLVAINRSFKVELSLPLNKPSAWNRNSAFPIVVPF